MFIRIKNANSQITAISPTAITAAALAGQSNLPNNLTGDDFPVDTTIGDYFNGTGCQKNPVETSVLRQADWIKRTHLNYLKSVGNIQEFWGRDNVRKDAIWATRVWDWHIAGGCYLIATNTITGVTLTSAQQETLIAHAESLSTGTQKVWYGVMVSNDAYRRGWIALSENANIYADWVELVSGVWVPRGVDGNPGLPIIPGGYPDRFDPEYPSLIAPAQ